MPPWHDLQRQRERVSRHLRQPRRPVRLPRPEARPRLHVSRGEGAERVLLHRREGLRLHGLGRPVQEGTGSLDLCSTALRPSSLNGGGHLVYSLGYPGPVRWQHFNPLNSAWETNPLHL